MLPRVWSRGRPRLIKSEQVRNNLVMKVDMLVVDNASSASSACCASIAGARSAVNASSEQERTTTNVSVHASSAVHRQSIRTKNMQR